MLGTAELGKSRHYDYKEYLWYYVCGMKDSIKAIHKNWAMFSKYDEIGRRRPMISALNKSPDFQNEEQCSKLTAYFFQLYLDEMWWGNPVLINSFKYISESTVNPFARQP